MAHIAIAAKLSFIIDPVSRLDEENLERTHAGASILQFARDSKETDQQSLAIIDLYNKLKNNVTTLVAHDDVKNFVDAFVLHNALVTNHQDRFTMTRYVGMNTHVDPSANLLVDAICFPFSWKDRVLDASPLEQHEEHLNDLHMLLSMLEYCFSQTEIVAHLTNNGAPFSACARIVFLPAYNAFFVFHTYEGPSLHHYIHEQGAALSDDNRVLMTLALTTTVMPMVNLLVENRFAYSVTTWNTSVHASRAPDSSDLVACVFRLRPMIAAFSTEKEFVHPVACAIDMAVGDDVIPVSIVVANLSWSLLVTCMFILFGSELKEHINSETYERAFFGHKDMPHGFRASHVSLDCELPLLGVGDKSTAKEAFELLFDNPVVNWSTLDPMAEWICSMLFILAMDAKPSIYSRFLQELLSISTASAKSLARGQVEPDVAMRI